MGESQTITLPSGGTVTLRDAETFLSGERRRVMKAVLASPEDGEASLRFVARETLLALMVESWSLPYMPDAPLPSVDPSVLDRLQIPDYNMLYDATDAPMGTLFPPAATPDDADKPGSPTGPVGGS